MTRFTPGGTRTHNLTLRRGAPYPLGHGGVAMALNGDPMMAARDQKLANQKVPPPGIEPGTFRSSV